jgi:hypothetical protein
MLPVVWRQSEGMLVQLVLCLSIANAGNNNRCSFLLYGVGSTLNFTY